MIGELLLRNLKDTKYLCWDTETENLNQYFSRPWQVGFIVATLDKILESHCYYIWWDNLNVSPEAIKVTRFDYDKYKSEAKPAKEVLGIFETYLYDPKLFNVAHNLLNFDCYQHNTWRRELGIKPDYSYLQRTLDTNCLSKAYKKGFKLEEGGDRLAWQWKLANFHEKGVKTSLGTMAKEFGIPFDFNSMHEANNDVKITWQVLRNLIWKLEI